MSRVRQHALDTGRSRGRAAPASRSRQMRQLGRAGQRATWLMPPPVGSVATFFVRGGYVVQWPSS